MQRSQSSGLMSSIFAVGPAMPVDSPFSMTVGPDGDVYVGSFYQQNVRRFDGLTGQPLGIVASVASSQLSIVHAPR